MMMVMGEAVIVLLLPYYDTKTAKSSYFFSVCACWLLFLYGVQVSRMSVNINPLLQSILCRNQFPKLARSLARSIDRSVILGRA